MNFNVSNSINSAIVSGQLGLQRASSGITEASVNIAQQNRQATTTDELLSNVATNQIGQVKSLLPQSGGSMTDNLLSLQINANNALASTKVIGVASDTIGRIIDELA